MNNVSSAEDKAKTKVVEVKNIALAVPISWKEEKPSSRLRLTQFSIPATDGDEEGAELTVFSFGRSSVDDNLKRWIGQFGSEDRQSKVTSGTAKLGKYVLVEVSGTYNKPIGPPIAGKTQPTKNSRMLALILDVPDKGTYYLKMTGSDKTVASQAQAFRNSFGAEADKEKEYKLAD